VRWAAPAPNHSPLLDFDEDAMVAGAKALAALTLDQNGPAVVGIQ
jgi:metal-dependent amidase/aminoacylase/carboxypeptidase family protein